MKTRILKWFLFLLTVSLFLFFGIVWYFSGVIVAFKTKSHNEIKERNKVSGPSQFGLPENPEDIEIPAGELKLSGWFFKNPRKNKKCGVVIAHGHANNRYGVLKYSPAFWKRGCDLLFFDHRHHGISPGEFGTYGYHERKDVLSAVEVLRQKTGLEENRIGIFGESYGASTSLLAACMNDRLAFVGADSPYMDLTTIVSEKAEAQYGKILLPILSPTFWVAGKRADFDPYEVNVKEAVKNLRIPVFISHSAQDKYTVPRHSELIYQNISYENKMLHITNWGAEHARSMDVNPKEYEKHLDEFIEKYVPAFK